MRGLTIRCRSGFSRDRGVGLSRLKPLLHSFQLPSGYCFTLTLIVLLAATAAGCSLTPKQVEQLRDQVERRQDTALTCPPAERDRCAEDTPLAALADQARHYVVPLEIGADALAARVHLIRSARERIEIQNYIFFSDDSGRVLLDEMIAAARRGVRVRLLVDALFSLSDLEELQRLVTAHERFEVRLYNPPLGQSTVSNAGFAAGILCCFRHINHRMHFKLVAVDDRFAILGGRNGADRYFDLDTRMNFRDFEVLVASPEVGAMRESFDAYWRHRRTVPAWQTRDMARRIQLPVGGASSAGGKSRAVLPKAKKPLTGAVARPDERRLRSQHPVGPGGTSHSGHSHANFPSGEGGDAWVDSSRERAVRLAEMGSNPGWQQERLMARAMPVDEVEYFWDPAERPNRLRRPSPSSERIFEVISGAADSVYLQSPYFVMSRDFRKVLERIPDAVSVRVSTNSLASTDAFPTYAIHRRQRHLALDRLGFEIFELKPYPADRHHYVPRYAELIAEKVNGIAGPARGDPATATRKAPGPRMSLHAKLLVVDDEVSVVTSHNLDPRSERYNTENGIVVRGREFVRFLKAGIESDMAPRNSWYVGPRYDGHPVSRASRTIAGWSRRLPTLDLWPVRHTQNYQLPTGGEQVPWWHEDFFDNWVPAGEGPEVVRRPRLWATGFISRMMGFLQPIM